MGMDHCLPQLYAKTKNHHHQEPLSARLASQNWPLLSEKTKKHVKVQTAMLIVSPTSIKCNNILVAEINNRALCLPKPRGRPILLQLGKVGSDKDLRRLQ